MLRSLTVAAVLLLLSISAAAQVRDADLSLHLSPSPGTLKYHPREFLTWSVNAVNKGPQFAENVLVVFNVPGEIVALSPSSMTCNDVSPIRCTMPSLPSNNPGSGNVSITTRAPAAPGSYTATATITGATNDPNPADNTVAVSFTVSDAPDLVVSIPNGVNRIIPGERRGVSVFLGTGGQVAHDVRLSLRPTGGATIAFISAPTGFSCSNGVCTAATFGPEPGVFGLNFVAPDRDDGGTIGLEVEATSNDTEFDSRDNRASFSAFLVRQFPVTSTADAGNGSLRQAILDADALCADVPCRIIVSAAGTIHPQSPLPPVGGIVNLDGQGIEIRGDRLPYGDGLTIDAACEVQVQGLTITGFAGNGITIGSSVPCHPAVTLNVPVVVAVNTITGNLRGIVGSAADTVWIRDNTIGSNRRSAIFLYGGRVAVISHNLLQSNGASGIYVSLFSANIFENTITGNTDFGIAVAATAPAIGMRRNSISGNGHTAIDVGLDLESPADRPLLVDAHYDAATDKTIVRGRYDTERNNGTVVLELFASAALNARGHAQAERFLGQLKVQGIHGEFEFSTSGDLRGQWIAATTTIEDFLTVVRDVTSELSAPLRVVP